MGSPALPGSKSHTNRALVCAALAEGTSSLSGLLVADDTMAMVDGIEALGATVELDGRGARATIGGIGGRPTVDGRRVDARLSGTTSRFLLPVAAAGSGRTVIDGRPPLRRRPFADLAVALGSLGSAVTALAVQDHLPFEVGGGVEGGRIEIPGSVSSQFVSGLLLAAPLFSSPVVITLIPPVVSRPYLDMTVDVMADFGVRVECPDELTFVVEPARYQAAAVTIEPDASAASYFMAAAAITGGTVRIAGLDRSSRQGDVEFADLLAELGADVEVVEGSITVTGKRLGGGRFDLRHISDTAQTLAAVGAFADEAVVVEGIGFVREKETDRIAAIVTELARCGVDAEELADGFVVRPDVARLHGAEIETYDDHRMAMSMSLMGLRVPGIRILDPECVGKTFPDFFDVLETLRRTPRSRSVTPVVALDGPAGSGKSTVARRLAEALGIPHLDTGAMYRAVAAAVLRAGVDPESVAEVEEIAAKIALVVGERVLIDGIDATEEIRSPPVTAAVSAVSANPAVRRLMVARQREWATSLGGGVMEGRDIGTAVFPDAVLKVYLTASPEVRARRRYQEGATESLAEVAENIRRRDLLDSTRADSPLSAALDALVIDTSEATIAEVVEQLAELYRTATMGDR